MQYTGWHCLDIQCVNSSQFSPTTHCVLLSLIHLLWSKKTKIYGFCYSLSVVDHIDWDLQGRGFVGCSLIFNALPLPGQSLHIFRQAGSCIPKFSHLPKFFSWSSDCSPRNLRLLKLFHLHRAVSQNSLLGSGSHISLISAPQFPQILCLGQAPHILSSPRFMLPIFSPRSRASPRHLPVSFHPPRWILSPPHPPSGTDSYREAGNDRASILGVSFYSPFSQWQLPNKQARKIQNLKLSHWPTEMARSKEMLSHL